MLTSRREFLLIPLLIPFLLAAGLAAAIVPTGRIAAVGALAAGLGVLIRAFGLRVSALAVAILVVPPGLIGEGSSRTTVITFLVILALVLPVPAERGHDLLPASLAMGGIALAFFYTAHRDLTPPFTAIGLTWLPAAVCAYSMAQRPALSSRAFLAFVSICAAEVASYVVSLLIGFRLGPHTLHFKARHADLYFPFTFTSGSGGFWGSHPRLSMFSGEGGLAAVVLLIALALALKLLPRGRAKTAIVALLGLGVVFAQSSAAVVALAVMVTVILARRLTTRLTFLPAAIAMALPALAVERLAQAVVHAKMHENAGSLADRGFLTSGTYLNDISVRAALHHHVLIGVGLIVLMAYLAVRSVHDPVGLGLVAGVGVMAWYAQPLQDHPGIWFILVAFIPLLERGRARLGNESKTASVGSADDVAWAGKGGGMGRRLGLGRLRWGPNGGE